MLMMVLALGLAQSGYTANPTHDQGSGQESAQRADHPIAAWGEVIKPLVFRTINFAIFVGLLVFFLRKPVQSFLNNRRNEVQETINKSAERKAWAEQMFSDYNKR